MENWKVTDIVPIEDGITKSNVDAQDEKTLDDVESFNDLFNVDKMKDIGIGTAKSSAFALNSSYNTAAGIAATFGASTPSFKSLFGIEESNTSKEDEITRNFEILREGNHKNVKMHSKMGQYTDYTNFVLTSFGMLNGTLGDSLPSSVVNELTNSFTKGLGVGTIVEKLINVANLKEGVSEIKDSITGMLTANESTILTIKPGTKIRDVKKITNDIKKYNIVDYNNVETNIASEIINDIKTKEEKTVLYNLKEADLNNIGTEEDLENREKLFDRVNYNFREIGGLYIEPYYSKGGKLKSFEIPFEFNPTISGEGYSASYQSATAITRMLEAGGYTGTKSNDITITTKYFVTAPDNDTQTDNRWTNRWTNGWLKDWTPSRIRKIENQYRMLVMPYILYGRQAEFVKPPIIRIKMRTLNAEEEAGRVGVENYTNTYANVKEDKVNDTTVSDLYKYPSVEGKLQVTSSYDGETREKRYVATSVSISSIEDNVNSYIIPDIGMHDYKRAGFSVTVNLKEVTKNFLDLIPNYGDYLNAIGTENSTNLISTINDRSSRDSLLDYFGTNVQDQKKIQNIFKKLYDYEKEKNK